MENKNRESFSEETVLKIRMKLGSICDYFKFYQEFKENFNTGAPIKYHQSDQDLFRDIIHGAILPLYRSLFKNIENNRMRIEDFTNDQAIISSHNAIMTFADKDICHHDIKSETFKVERINQNGQAIISRGMLSDEQLEKIIIFLKNNFAEYFDVEIN